MEPADRASQITSPPATTPPSNSPDLTPSLPAINQTACFFFAFPPEIRNRIYTFSLESEDTSSTSSTNTTDNASTSPSTTRHYRQNAFYYRPGYSHPKRIRTALLQTCQQIYTEASLLPPSINTHTFWFYRAPPHISNASSPSGYFSKMTPQQRDQVRHIHLFTQQYFLEDGYWTQIWTGSKPSYRGQGTPACPVTPRVLTITLRHTDWWFWENNEPLGIDPFRTGRTHAHDMGQPLLTPYGRPYERAWGNQFTAMPSLEELVIEFETIMRKRDQLDAIVEWAVSWKFPLQREKKVYLVADPSSRRAYTWTGAKKGDLKMQPGTGRMAPNPHVIPEEEEGEEGVPAQPVLRPFDAKAAGVVAPSSKRRDDGDSTTEEYYVVFLTWKRQVVDQC